MASCDAALLPFVSNFVWFHVYFTEGYATCVALGYILCSWQRCFVKLLGYEKVT